MKKAFVDQIILGFLLFSSLIVLGATISDNMQARDKYYNLKKITDNSVLTLAKYYVNVREDTTEAEDINYEMLEETKLGNEIKDKITYTWDFVSEPNTVTATLLNYEEDTFWLKFINLDSLTLKASSQASITVINTNSPTSSYSAGIAPFAINDRDFTIGDSIDMDYSITADWAYADKNTFYPVITNCDCDCSFILSNKFDFSELGFASDSCNESSSGCTTHGESEFRHYTKDIVNIYNAEQSINFENGETDTPICLIGTYLGNSNSTWTTQINHLSMGIYDIIGSDGSNLPLEMDIITLGSNGIANGVVRVNISTADIKKGGNSGYITLNTQVVSTKSKEVELVY
jgi:hypothetical protein